MTKVCDNAIKPQHTFFKKKTSNNLNDMSLRQEKHYAT